MDVAPARSHTGTAVSSSWTAAVPGSVASAGVQVARVELGPPEEDVGALGFERDQFPQDDASGGAGESTEVLQIRLALVGTEELHDRTQVGQVE